MYRPAVLCMLVLAPMPLCAQASDSASAIAVAKGISWRQAGIGLGLLALASTLDGPIARSFQSHRTAGSLNTARQFDRFGDLTGEAPILGGLALASFFGHNGRLGKATLRAAVSAGLAAIATQGIKHVVGRHRPVEDPDLDAYDFQLFTGHQSFPSGHTAAAFALATSLGDGIGHTWARIALYGLATGTAWARMEEHEHFLSDVLGGAAVGFLAAKWSSGRLRVFGLRAPKVLVSSQGATVIWTADVP
ncbi:MAG: phosphatase PAP2 family protein [Gemmatimonadales bacterium]